MFGWLVWAWPGGGDGAVGRGNSVKVYSSVIKGTGSVGTRSMVFSVLVGILNVGRL